MHMYKDKDETRVCVCVVSSKSYVDGVFDQLGIKCCKAARSRLEVILLLFWGCPRGRFFFFLVFFFKTFDMCTLRSVCPVRPSVLASFPPPSQIR